MCTFALAPRTSLALVPPITARYEIKIHSRFQEKPSSLPESPKRSRYITITFPNFSKTSSSNPQSIYFQNQTTKHTSISTYHFKMPSSFETTVQQILQAENKDQRSQPWKAEMKSLIETPVNDAAEVVPTGGACDVLKFIFPC